MKREDLITIKYPKFDIDYKTIENEDEYEYYRTIRNQWRDQAFKSGVDYLIHMTLLYNIKFIDKYLSEWELRTKEII